MHTLAHISLPSRWQVTEKKLKTVRSPKVTTHPTSRALVARDDVDSRTVRETCQCSPRSYRHPGQINVDPSGGGEIVFDTTISHPNVQ